MPPLADSYIVLMESAAFDGKMDVLRSLFQSFKVAIKDARRARESLIDQFEQLKKKYQAGIEQVGDKENKAVALKDYVVDKLDAVLRLDVEVMDPCSKKAGLFTRAIRNICGQMASTGQLSLRMCHWPLSSR